MAELAIWVLTVLAIAAYVWATWSWPRVSIRVASAVPLLAVWLIGPFFADMGPVWRVGLPLVLAAGSMFVLIRRTDGPHRGWADPARTEPRA